MDATAGSSQLSATFFVISVKSQVRRPRPLAPTAARNSHGRRQETATCYTTNASRKRALRQTHGVSVEEIQGSESFTLHRPHFYGVFGSFLGAFSPRWADVISSFWAVPFESGCINFSFSRHEGDGDAPNRQFTVYWLLPSWERL